MGRDRLQKFTATAHVSTARGTRGQLDFPSRDQFRGASVDHKNSAADNRLHLHLIAYCTSLEPYGAPWKDEPGLSVRMVCGAKRNTLLDLEKAMDAYCAFVKQSQEWPGTFKELQKLYRFRFVATLPHPQDECGLWRPYACTCYMPGRPEVVQAWLVLMDDFFSWRWTKADFSFRCELPSIVVHNRARLPLDLSDKENFTCSVKVSPTAAGQGSSSYMGVRSVDVPPPVTPLMNLIWHLAATSGDKIDITITGNTSAFAQGLRAAAVPRKTLRSDAFYRSFYVLHDYALTSAKAREFLLKDLVEGVFKSVPIAVRVAGPLTGEAQAFHKALRGLPNVFPVV